jgi:hypothetical protein
MNNKQNNTNKFGWVLAVTSFCELYPGICLTTEEKAQLRKKAHNWGKKHNWGKITTTEEKANNWGKSTTIEEKARNWGKKAQQLRKKHTTEEKASLLESLADLIYIGHRDDQCMNPLLPKYIHICVCFYMCIFSVLCVTKI